MVEKMFKLLGDFDKNRKSQPFLPDTFLPFKLSYSKSEILDKVVLLFCGSCALCYNKMPS